MTKSTFYQIYKYSFICGIKSHLYDFLNLYKRLFLRMIFRKILISIFDLLGKYLLIRITLSTFLWVYTKYSIQNFLVLS